MVSDVINNFLLAAILNFGWKTPIKFIGLYTVFVGFLGLVLIREPPRRLDPIKDRAKTESDDDLDDEK